MPDLPPDTAAHRDLRHLRLTRHSLNRAVAKAAGVQMLEIDRERLHEYSAADQRRYVVSETHGTRELTFKKLGLS